MRRLKTTEASSRSQRSEITSQVRSTRRRGSAKKPASPKRESVRNESSGHRERATFAVFQRDLLGQHDISDRQLVRRHETQAKCWPALLVDLANVHPSARIDPILLAGVAADDFEIALFREVSPLSWRQPSPQKPQGAAFRCALGAVSNEESTYCSHPRTFIRPRPPKAQHAGRPITRRPAWERTRSLPRSG